ncbi:MAG: hypothetical protein ABEL51_00810 [Salinibacter sp.]
MARRRYYAVVRRSVKRALRDASHPYHQPLKRLFHKHIGQSTEPYTGKLLNKHTKSLEISLEERHTLRDTYGIESIRDLVDVVLESAQDQSDRDLPHPTESEESETVEEAPPETNDNTTDQDSSERSDGSAEGGEGMSAPGPDDTTPTDAPDVEEPSTGSAGQDPSPDTEESSSQGDGRPDPEDRGGRPRTEEPTPPSPTPPTSQRPRIEIQCVPEGQEWQLVAALESPNDDQVEALAVHQDGQELEPADPENLSWRLNGVTGTIKAKMESNQEPITKTLDNNGHLAFRLATDQGRYVEKPTQGHYLVIVPDSWERDEGLSGSPAVHPEPCSVQGYKAHYFHLDESSSTIAFHIPEYGRHIIDSRAPTFSIAGQRVEDEIPKRGELFIGDVPKIRASNAGEWSKVNEVVVGEEGPGQGRWRQTIYPDPSAQEQPLPPELQDRELGWYFVRFYDENKDLIDSESRHFRYIASINRIDINKPSPVPTSSGGHTQARIVFHHEPDCRINCDNDHVGVQVRGNHEETVAEVPPDPAADVARFRVSASEGRSVDIALAMKRLWWAVGTEDGEPEQWTDQLVALSKADFRAASNRALWIRLPQPGRLEQMRLGFSSEEKRAYKAKKTDRTMCIPLRDFGESAALRSVGEHALTARFTVGEEQHSLAIASMKLNASCTVDNCEFESSDTQDVVNHVVESHTDKYFLPLTYEELRERMHGLPSEIHRCPYCSFWVPGEHYLPEDSPTSEIVQHCDEEHPDKKASDKVVKDVTDISDIYPNISTIYKCKICHVEFSNPDAESRERHLIDQHSDELYVLI